MALVRCFAAAISDGVPFAGIVADPENPSLHQVIGNGGVHRQVTHRLRRASDPPDLRILSSTLEGSHIWVSPWEQIGTTEIGDAAAAVLHIIRTGEPLPEAVVIRPAR